MIDELRRVRAVLSALLGSFDPDCVTAADAAAVVEEVAGCERALSGLRLLAAGRAAVGEAWRAAGATSATAWLAATTGTTAAEAAATLDAARCLPDAPAVEAALRSGALSADQATAITPAAAADPAASDRLLAEASTGTVEQLRRTSRSVSAAAQPALAEAAQARIHATRHLRTWTDGDGAVCGRFRLTAIAGATLAAALTPFHDRVFGEVRAAGGRERADAISADALVAMAEAAVGRGGRAGTDHDHALAATVVARIDLDALERGCTTAGEESSIDGVGPVPVSTVRSLLPHARLVALVTDGPRIVDVRLAGRVMPDRLRHAVVARDRHCVVPACGATRHLQIHHWHTDVGDGGDTYLDGLALVCRWHHDQITHRGADLTRDPVPPGAPGGWRYTPPPFDPPGTPAGNPFDRELATVHPGLPPPAA